MKFIVFLLITIIGVQGSVFPVNRIFGRIVNGENAIEGQFPWHVSIISKINNRDTLCGGSIIANNWILTAAHCVKYIDSFKIGIGSTKLHLPQIMMTSTESFIHPNYDPLSLNFDIGLIKLPEKISFNDNIKAIKLPNLSQVNTTFFNYNGIVSGFGQTSDSNPDSSEILKWVDLRVITNQECAEVYGGEIIIKSTVCARGIKKSPCTGDSGGPFVINENDQWIQMGVVSFVSYDGCEDGKPAGFTRTASFLDWIASVTDIEIEE